MPHGPANRRAGGVHAAAWMVAACLVVGGASGPALARVFEPPADPVADDLDRRLREDVRPLLVTYCVECHSGAKPKGDLDLGTLATLRDATGMLDNLRVMKEMVSTGEMPPKKASQPSDHERLVVQQWLEGMENYSPPGGEVDPGWFTIHRLNRAEYRSTMRDLLGIDPKVMDVAERLPRDDTGYGFDNIADVLTMSTLAVEQYLDAAERSLAAALGPELEFGGAPRPVTPLVGTGKGQTLPSGGFFLYSAGAAEGVHEFAATGEYDIEVEAWETHGGDENAKLSLRIDGVETKTFSISGTQEHPQRVKVRVRIKAGRRTLSAHFTNDYWKPDAADRNLGIERISVAGPMDEGTTERPAAWKEIFRPREGGVAAAGEKARAQDIMERFAARAYRRPLRDDEREAFGSLFRSQREEGRSFESAVRMGLTAALVSPSFLYRSLENPDSGDPGRVYRLSGYELASRLSYFLWSSMPDERLISLARDGTLREDGVLREEVSRMLADARCQGFVDNFAGQWLQLRTLDTLAMDRTRFAEYDPELRAAMVGEAKMFFADVIRSDRSVKSFLESDYSFLNERLARFYGVEGVTGAELRRVGFPKGSPRGGVLTMGAVLTVTSNTTRTSPVKRGLYVLDQILGTPPPPPPADIPPLEQASAGREGATLREQLKAHVANPSCAVCHNRLDPLGLAFENFDAIGRWREEEGGRPIDAAGTLPGGASFSGPRELKQILLDRGAQFVETLSGKVLMYAIGRGLEPFDRSAVRRIAEYTGTHGDRMRAMIEAVVLSETFRSCRGREREHE